MCGDGCVIHRTDQQDDLCIAYDVCKDPNKGGAYCLQGGIQEHGFEGCSHYGSLIQTTEQLRSEGNDLGYFVEGFK